MRRFAATVTILSLRRGDKPYGIAATAVSSLSTDPPSIIICVNRSASIHGHLLAERAFSANILHQDQFILAQTFSDSSKREERFSSGEWQDDGGLPYLADAQATLFCENVQQMSYGTHSIVVGLVNRVRLRQEIDPLLYVDGRFARAT